MRIFVISEQLSAGRSSIDLLADRLFHIFCVLEFVDQSVLFSSESSFDGF